MVRWESAAFKLSGPSVATCLQGLLTNDVEKLPVNGMTYGALLTPKGMIIVDAWVIREAVGYLLLVDLSAQSATLELLRRQLPPRLARAADSTEQIATLLIFGNGPESRLGPNEIAGLPAEISICNAPPTAPFQFLVTGDRESIDRSEAVLAAAGVEAGTTSDLAIVKALAGWPSLGREIGGKTLPQEVRYDEIGGISYTKGCYVGQETVARLHFRGHPNWLLRGLRFEGVPALPSGKVSSGSKEVGSVTSIVTFEGGAIALASVRREVEVGASVSVDGTAATLVSLPFELPT